MEDENAKEENQPSTSKKESGHDLYDDGRDDRGSNTETSVSASYSARSRIDMADGRQEVTKPPAIGKREREPKPPKVHRRQRAKRSSGKVEKRRRSYTRRHLRRLPKRKHRRDEKKDERRDLSVSTIFTRFSSRSGSRAPGCIHCGHRCCRRRYYYYERHRRHRPRTYQRRRKIIKGRLKKKRQIKRIVISRLSGSEQIQVGSRSAMFSPLFVNTTSEPIPEALTEQRNTYCEVSPQMIYNGLKRLSVWRQYINTSQLMFYIRSKYPVNPVEAALYQELKEKLRVAAIVGIVVEPYEDHWSLSSALQRRHLTVNHVTAFWRAYADTMSPIRSKKPEMYQAVYTDKGNSNETHKDKARELCDDTI